MVYHGQNQADGLRFQYPDFFKSTTGNLNRMKVELLYFASIREMIGKSSETVPCPDSSSLDNLKGLLLERYPALSGVIHHARWAVNEDFEDMDFVLSDGDRVAMIMPVSGGSEPEIGPPEILIAELTHDTINTQELINRVSDPRCGAVCLFLGTVREFTGSQQTNELIYEAYPEMALNQLRKILSDACQKWPIPRLGVIHRLGKLGLGETSIAVAVSTPHRVESFAACQWIMDTIKQDVPIWKKENFSNGTAQWVHPS